MAIEYYLGIDIGASSGRHVLGHREGGELVMEEIYRFPNQIQNQGGRDCWNIEALFAYVVEGIKRCAAQQKLPRSLSIDTWGCDFVLLDEQERRMGDCVSYRDSRVDGMPEKAFQILAKEKVYQKTGIQFQKFNTLYQLLALQEMQPEQLAAAAHFLMIPDYLHYRLTGRITNEYTNASTTQMVNAAGQVWDEDILAAFGLPRRIFKDFTPVGEVIGGLTEVVKKAAGLEPGQDILVLEGATHDTASAFAGALKKDGLILSSGTWSLLGKIISTPIVSELAQRYNFTNEGYPGGRNRVIYHAHCTNLIALTFLLPLEDEIFSRELWEMMTECPVIFPEGLGVVEWMVPGGREIAVATSRKMETYNAVIWAHHGLFVSGQDFNSTFGLMHTIEKSAEIWIKVHSGFSGKRQTIPVDGFRALAKDFHIVLNEKVLYDKTGAAFNFDWKI